MENISNDTDLRVFRYLLLPLFLQRGNKFLIYFGIQCCQITVSNTFEAIFSFWSPKIRVNLTVKTILNLRVNKGQNQLSRIAVTLKDEDECSSNPNFINLDFFARMTDTSVLNKYSKTVARMRNSSFCLWPCPISLKWNFSLSIPIPKLKLLTETNWA